MRNGKLKGVIRSIGKQHTLPDKVALELVEELERELVLRRQRLLTNDGLHGCRVTADGVFRVQLVRHIAVVAASELLADGALHQTTETGQDVDGRVDLSVVQLAIDEDLALRDVARKVRNGMRNICEVSVEVWLDSTSTRRTHRRWAWSRWESA